MEEKNILPLEPRSGSILVAVGFNPRSEANEITQFANGEPKRWNNDTVRVFQPLEGGNGATNGSVVTL